MRPPLSYISRTVLIVIAVGAVAVSVHQSQYWIDALGAVRAPLLMIATAAFALGLVFAALRAKAPVAQRLALEIVTLVFVLIAVEFCIISVRPATWTADPVARESLQSEGFATKLGIDFDSRTASEVVNDLRAEGVDALPGIGRGWARRPEVRSQLAPDFYPLSQASNATIVECNENGEYLVYRTDELGFNNPSGLLLGEKRIDIAVVGESHALGHCVKAGRSFVDVIRRAHPRTVNLGLADTRSLSQLASFREYVEPLRPRIVLWVVNPGFAADTEESRDPILVRYLEPGFSQGLIRRQDEVDAAVRHLSPPIRAAGDRALKAEMSRARAERFRRVPKLDQVRQQLGPRHKENVAHPDLSLFSAALQAARVATDAWGGRLLVVVMPEYGLLLGQRPEQVRYESVMRLLHEQALPVIDGAALFRSQEDPTRLFALGAGGHPDAQGHALIAKQVLAELRRQGIGPDDQEAVDVDKRAFDANSKSVRARLRAASRLLSLTFARERDSMELAEAR